MDKSCFVDVFGDSPRVLVLDYLLDNRILDFCKSDIAEATGISRSTLNNFFEILLKNIYIVKSRRIGRAQLYKVNKKNIVIQKLTELDVFLTKKKSP